MLGVKCSWELQTNDSKIILSFPSLMAYQIKVESEALVISTVDFGVQSWSHILGKDLLKLSLTKLKALKSSPKSTMGMSMSNTELHAEEAINNHHSLLGDVYMEEGQVLLVWLALARGASPRVYMGRAALLIVLATFIFPRNPEPIFAYN